MSAFLHNLSSNAVVASGLYPVLISANGHGSTVDLTDCDGPCFAVQQVGALTGDAVVTGSIEQSADGSSWSAISGAAFAAADAANGIQLIQFTRTARYVRWAVTITGDDPTALVAVAFMQQKKVF
jgi:hypothetical protein